MKVLILYDSVYGNTEKIAQAIGSAFGTQEEASVVKAGAVNPGQFGGLELLIAGSPTQRFRPTPAISNLLKGIPANTLKGVNVTAFDTRLTMSTINKTPILAFFVKLYGSPYAARPVADQLKKKGGKLIVPPEGFFVDGMEGPLVEGELERAANWARKISAAIRG